MKRLLLALALLLPSPLLAEVVGAKLNGKPYQGSIVVAEGLRIEFLSLKFVDTRSLKGLVFRIEIRNPGNGEAPVQLSRFRILDAFRDRQYDPILAGAWEDLEFRPEPSFVLVPGARRTCLIAFPPFLTADKPAGVFYGGSRLGGLIFDELTPDRWNGSLVGIGKTYYHTMECSSADRDPDDVAELKHAVMRLNRLPCPVCRPPLPLPD